MARKENFHQLGKRQLKVHYKHISWKYHNHIIVPEIRLCGKWLQACGFKYGQTTTVRHEEIRIIITLNDKAETKD